MNPQDQINQSLPDPVKETPAQRWGRQFREGSVAIDVARMAMAHSLDAALHGVITPTHRPLRYSGVITARPESPKIVWEALLDEVERLAQGARSDADDLV